MTPADGIEGVEQTNSHFRIPSIPGQSSRSQRAARRASACVQTSPSTKPTGSFKAPPKAFVDVYTPTKANKQFLRPSRTSATPNSPRASSTSKTFKQPMKLATSTEIGTRDMQDLIAQKKDNLRHWDRRARPSDLSATESSFPSNLDDASDSSPLTSPPSSPGIGTSPIEPEFEKTKSPGREAPITVCPVCRVPVDGEFLVKFNNGERLRSRQQLRFCNAHKARSAKSEWAAKGFPEIQWSQFDRRLHTYHPVIDAIVTGKKASFYRNAAADRIKQSSFTSIKQMYGNTASLEGLSPGYYGSRGARAMYVSINNLSRSFQCNAAAPGLQPSNLSP